MEAELRYFLLNDHMIWKLQELTRIYAFSPTDANRDALTEFQRECRLVEMPKNVIKVDRFDKIMAVVAAADEAMKIGELTRKLDEALRELES